MKRINKTLIAFVMVLALMMSIAQTALAHTYYSRPLDFASRVPTADGNPDEQGTSEQPEDPDLAEQPEDPKQPQEEQPADEGEQTPVETPVSYEAYVNSVDGASIYTQPNATSGILADLVNGARVMVIGEMDAWAHIDAEGLQGYVLMSLLTHAELQLQDEQAPAAITAFLTLEAPDAPRFGDMVTINCHVTGGTGEERVMWQYALTDSDGKVLSDWSDADADALSKTVELTPESLCTAWRVRIDTPDL